MPRCFYTSPSLAQPVDGAASDSHLLIFGRWVALLISIVLLTGWIAAPVAAQNAEVQLIHNAPDPAASTVDIYFENSSGDVEKFDNVDFRTATAFLTIPADTYDIVVADETSTGISDQVLHTKTGVTFNDGIAYHVVAIGVLDSNQFEANPTGRSTAFDVLINEDVLTSNSDALVRMRVAAGAPDLPAVNLEAPGGTLVGNIPFPDDTNGYISLPEDEYPLSLVDPNDASTVYAEFRLDLTGRASTPAYLLFTGFDTPGNEAPGAPELRAIAVFPDGTTEVLLPSADLQVVHNAAGIGAVDVYLDDGINPPSKIDDLPFRGALNVSAPAGESITVSLNAESSSGISDQQVASTTTTLDPDSFNQAFAVGESAGSADVLIQANRNQTSAGGAGTVGLLVGHQSPDAGPVDALTRGVQAVDDIAYTDFQPASGYVTVPTGDYIIRITDDANTAFVGSVLAPLTSLGVDGQTVTVLASGFVNPGTGEPSLALLAVPSEAADADPLNNTIVLQPDASLQTLVVNEFFADPSDTQDPNGDGTAGGDADEEFIELVNVSGAELDISGYEIVDAANNTYTVPAGTTLDPGGSATIFQGGTPTNIPGFTDTGSPALNNGGDDVRIVNAQGTVVDRITYSALTPENDDESTTRNPDYFGPMALSSTDLGQSPPYTPGRLNDGSGVLPVELAQFNAFGQGDTVQLVWTTLSEQKNSGFEIQQRIDGAFQTVGFRQGQGTTTERTEYRFQIGDLSPGTHAFRLRQVDLDGAATLSRVVNITVALDERYAWSSVSPHPVAETAHSTLQVRTAQPVKVTLYDLLGRKVQTLYDDTMTPGRGHDLAIDAQSLPSGTYFLRATGETFSATRRVTVVR
ncbi:hypothetical protein CRI94_11745 [Longibacter salinarum]|uniref:LTD domain-containing protein n=1 Tax=Longibacter salinarum TaxID=1850348 RepID=A0A2A8CXJ2_9BACT|nr:DUF4397 domain-containing protein [Longibacter salinarum]PEN13304.1 hypothetical protein CRI94_11745 [Longibacter salinarum]